MARFTVLLAGEAVEITSLFESTRDYCGPYLTQQPARYHIAVTPQDLIAEQAWLDEEAKRESLRRRSFSNPFLERNFLQRRCAQLLLPQNILLLHGSAIAADGKGYLFTAKCGTGKSTHTRLWQQLLGRRAVMVNDDKPLLRRTSTGWLLCGSPWTGKHGLGSNLSVPLAGICLLHRGTENSISPLTARQALPHLSAACDLSTQRLLQQLADQIPLWKMECTPTVQAAETAFRAMTSSTETG